MSIQQHGPLTHTKTTRNMDSRFELFRVSSWIGFSALMTLRFFRNAIDSQVEFTQ